MDRKAELVKAIKEICAKARITPEMFEPLNPTAGRRIELDVALNRDLNDKALDPVVNALNALTFNDKAYQVCPCRSVFFNGTAEQAGMKRIR